MHGQQAKEKLSKTDKMGKCVIGVVF